MCSGWWEVICPLCGAVNWGCSAYVQLWWHMSQSHTHKSSRSVIIGSVKVPSVAGLLNVTRSFFAARWIMASVIHNFGKFDGNPKCPRISDVQWNAVEFWLYLHRTEMMKVNLDCGAYWGCDEVRIRIWQRSNFEHFQQIRNSWNFFTYPSLNLNLRSTWLAPHVYTHRPLE